MIQQFYRHGLLLSYYDNQKAGPVLVFQHGLTGDHRQVLNSFHGENCRLITLECRGHGGSPLGPTDEISIATFSDDLFALLKEIEVKKATFAGISMGAAVVANFAARHPDMVKGLALIRPSWFDKRAPSHMAIFGIVTDFISVYGTKKGKQYFSQSDSYQKLFDESVDNANSLLDIFDRGVPESILPLIRQILTCDPELDLESLGNLNVPIRVLGTAQDAIHPLELARTIAAAIPGSAFFELFPKTLDKEKHFKELTTAVIKLV